MDHIVYLDFKSNELQNLLSNNKDIILRGATGRKLPYDRVSVNDTLYFCNNNGEKLLKAKGTVKKVIFTPKLSEEDSKTLIDSFIQRIKLSPKAMKRFYGKRYLSIIEVKNVVELDALHFNKDDFSNMDDWLLIEDLRNVL